ncbi:hypothetical protein PNIG_a2498 [Pseudoalteromonas nigrifaciens]|uniref:Uncharacterized protein n=1 Tax=Pseudoalteromonas nigrifaciens TaxID=28109 RepID=A0AAC9UIY8_9GAMM|nr:hypothetical protein [Pseudoalteromonas nigrifaciens]ASM54508.1 hypothetical protein PNIG_a2498 [Pseudoalteromonas nigrifaciens]GEN42054.1 hypothetical protein PNI02_15200 [Pseudoalteromonas nigrifaciens]SUC51670.1 Uncharacterised protein [Pseudoalteromonas nigrifaciens]
MVEENTLSQIGFKFGKNGAHSARSMMIEDLKLLLFSRDEAATQEDYREDIVNFNILHKPTEKSRLLTYRHLIDLYTLDKNITLFSVLRSWWEIKEDSQALLALQLAVARDPLLRSSVQVIQQLEIGEHLPRETMETFLAKDDPMRFSSASLKSFAQNINGTWTQAGYLSGKNKKYREIPLVSFVNVAYSLFLGHCNGYSGQRLFDSFWCQMLCQDMNTLYDLAYMASLRGLIKYKHAGDVIEISFPDITLPEL